MLITCDDDSIEVVRKMGSHFVYTTSDFGYVEMCVAHVYTLSRGQNIIEIECTEYVNNQYLFIDFIILLNRNLIIIYSLTKTDTNIHLNLLLKLLIYARETQK